MIERFTRNSILSMLIFLILFAGKAFAFDFDLKGSLGEGKHTHYVPPVSNPLFNESPFITTELRPIFMYQEIPDEFLTQGGKIHLIAAQVRVALNDRLGIIATKDGYADLDFEAGLPDEDGFANISFGLKYALLSQPENNAIVSVGIEYEAPSGNLSTGGIQLQGTADGFIDIFLTGAVSFGKLGLQSNIGANLALDGDRNTSLFHFAAHADYEVIPGLFPLIEFNTFTTIDDGTRLPVTFEGTDLVNFGSTSSGTVATFAAGFRYQIMKHWMVGFAYEVPISDKKDLLDMRTTADMVIYF